MLIRRTVLRLIHVALVGVVSACTAPTETLVLKTLITAPTVSFTNMPRMLKGGTPYRVEFSVRTQATVSVAWSRIQGSFVEAGTVTNGDTFFTWDVPAENVQEARLRLTAKGPTDSIMVSEPFEIRVAPPLFTETQQAPELVTRRASLTYGGACERDFTVQVHSVAADGTLSNVESFACENDAWTFAYTFPADGIYTFLFSQTDPVGNQTKILSKVTKRTGQPALTQSLAPAVSVSNTPSLAMGGACETGLLLKGTVALNGAAATNIPSLLCKTDGTWVYTANVTGDGSRVYKFSQTTDTNLTKTVQVTWELRTTPPVLTQTLQNAFVLNNQSTLTYGGACQAGLPIALTQTKDGAPDVLNRNVDCPSGSWATVVGASIDGRYRISFKQTDAAGNSKTIDVVWVRSAGLPYVVPGSLSLNGGAATTANNFLNVALSASSPASRLAKVTHLCLKYNDMAQPAPTHSCFVPVDTTPAPNVPPDFQITIASYPFAIGFIAGTYTVYSWVKDEAGNVSGNPVTGNALASIIYNPPRPPLMTEAYALSNPADSNSRTVSNGSPVYIFWKVTDEHGLQTGLAANPISLAVTTDHNTYTSIATGYVNGINNGCRFNYPTNPLIQNATGCAIWNSTVPTGKYFRIRVIAKGASGIVAYSQTNAVNQGSFNFLAGNLELGEGSTASAAILRPQGNQALVVHPSGKIFILDERGLMMVNSSDGVLRLLIRDGASAIEGPVATASLESPQRIALDYQNNVLIRDYRGIYKLDVENMRMTRFIGGGTSLAEQEEPLKLKVNPETGAAGREIFTPLPNGELLFMSDAFETTPNSTPAALIRRYTPNAGAGVVTSIKVGGYAPFMGKPGQSIGDCILRTAGVVFDRNNTSANPLTSMLLLMSASSRTGACAYDTLDNTNRGSYVSVNPLSFSAGPPTLPAPIPMKADGFREVQHVMVSGMNGKLYLFGPPGNFNYHAIVSYDGYGNWIPEVGMSPTLLSDERYPLNTDGECQDGTAKLSCPIKPVSVFVDERGAMYFIDENIVRTFTQDGKLITLVGQRRSSGDTGKPLDARLGDISDIHVWNDGTKDRFMLSELSHFRLREFTENGTIDSYTGASGLRGDDRAMTAIYEPPETEMKNNGFGTFPAPLNNKVNLMWQNDGSASIIAMMPNGNFFASLRRDLPIYNVNRQTNQWNPIGQTYPGYGSHPLAYNPANNTLLASSFSYCGDRTPISNGMCNGKLYTVDGSTGVRTLLVAPAAAGTSDYPLFINFCKYPFDPTVGCEQPAAYPAWSNANEFSATSTTDVLVPHAVTDSDGGWLIKPHRTTRVVKIKGTQIQVLATFANPARGFALKPDSRTLFYCNSNDGKLYSHNADGTEGSIAYPFPTMNCAQSMGIVVYSERRNSLIFSYEVNGLTGIAEVAIAP